MSEYTEYADCAPDDPEQTPLPEHFPSIAVSVQLGRELALQGETIEVDPQAMYDTMSGLGMHDRQVDATHIIFDKASAFGMLQHGGITVPQRLAGIVLGYSAGTLAAPAERRAYRGQEAIHRQAPYMMDFVPTIDRRETDR